jgi:hypothetical protein
VTAKEARERTKIEFDLHRERTVKSAMEAIRRSIENMVRLGWNQCSHPVDFDRRFVEEVIGILRENGYVVARYQRTEKIELRIEW